MLGHMFSSSSSSSSNHRGIIICTINNNNNNNHLPPIMPSLLASSTSTTATATTTTHSMRAVMGRQCNRNSMSTTSPTTTITCTTNASIATTTRNKHLHSSSVSLIHHQWWPIMSLTNQTTPPLLSTMTVTFNITTYNKILLNRCLATLLHLLKVNTVWMITVRTTSMVASTMPMMEITHIIEWTRTRRSITRRLQPLRTMGVYLLVKWHHRHESRQCLRGRGMIVRRPLFRFGRLPCEKMDDTV